jgi:hypothetical protein
VGTGRYCNDIGINLFSAVRTLLTILLFSSCIPLDHSQTGIGPALLRARDTAKDTTPIHIEQRWNWLRDVPEIHTP